MKNAQTSIEYGGLWILLAAVLITMAVFVRGHIQARQKQEGEKISQFLYIPGKTTINQHTTTISNTSSLSDDIHSESNSKVDTTSSLDMTTDVNPK